MKRRVRALAVSFWRWITGPASLLALALVGLYVFLVAWGPPLIALWLLARGTPLFTEPLIARALPPDGPDGAVGSYAFVVIEIAVLAVGWYLARRYLPPFRWRF